MQYRINSLILIGICITLSAACQRSGKDSIIFNPESDSGSLSFYGEQSAKEELQRFLVDSTMNLVKGEILIKDQEALISIAEPILFGVYGKNEIMDERPYEIYQFDDYWIMFGTMPKDMMGGTFTIVINRKTCKVVGISHGK